MCERVCILARIYVGHILGNLTEKINFVPFVEIRRATLQGLPCPGSQHPVRPVGLTGRAINCRNLTSTENIIFDCPDRDSRDEILGE